MDGGRCNRSPVQYNNACSQQLSGIAGVEVGVVDSSSRGRSEDAGLPVLDGEEQEAMDALLGVMNTITRTWDMTQNSSELASAVHVIQGFIIQHMLHRLAPEEWSGWTTPAVPEVEPLSKDVFFSERFVG